MSSISNSSSRIPVSLIPIDFSFFQKAFLKSRFNKWPQSLMLGGVVASVIGISIVFFTSSIFTGIGFTLLGVFSVIGLFIRTAAEDVKDTAIRLQRVAEKEKTAASSLDATAIGLKLTLDQINKRNAELRVTVGTLQNSVNQQNSSIQALEATSRELKADKLRLEGQLSQLREVLDTFRGGLSAFNQQNLQLKTALGILDRDLPALPNIELALGEAAGRLDEVLKRNLGELNRSILISRRDSTAVLERLQQQVSSLSSDATTLREQVTRLHATEQGLASTTSQLQRVMASRNETARKLELVRSEHATLEDSIKGTLLALKETREGLRESISRSAVVMTNEGDELSRTIAEFGAFINRISLDVDEMLSTNLTVENQLRGIQEGSV